MLGILAYGSILIPDTKFMLTDDVLRTALSLLARAGTTEAFNLCGQGLISPREISHMSGLPLGIVGESVAAPPRIVDVNLAKTSAVAPLPETSSARLQFLEEARHLSKDR